MSQVTILCKSRGLSARTEKALNDWIVCVEHDLLDDLTEMVESLGGQGAAAKWLGVSNVYVHQILHGKRPVTDEIAKRLGYRVQRVFVWEGRKS